ncbi:2-hydroxyacid dehydrogenase [Acidomonas methanolica]|uniref:2-hydroxyacid dehydrogenase n=1 Tax=Acidomonas methanolica NBRC 104435 TaxID=1231351 RepID=A0A023D8F1_ACIMT|nr:2-hydroxyacid dehydrogenase [Acidomonas methanolica]TCS27348.1 hypothetical protein EDC31_11168 [Acidomonas methanolica]GAJ30000.1 2-hydroxyacid dehydrogenase [Acidomonas methanolica NBRC 104435]GEK99626.1 dihydrofolate reductase [Acidomonas methanolica NBRC 104435]
MTEPMTERPQILQIDPLTRPVQERLDAAFTVHRFQSLDALAPVAAAIRGVATSPLSGLSSDIIDTLPHLEFVAVNGVGMDKIDLAACKRRGIHVTAATGVLSDDVADMAIGLMIDVLRGISAGDRFVRAGKWGREPVPNARTLTGKTVGVVGLGRIGRAVAERCAALKMKSAYFSRSRSADAAYPYYASARALAEASDVLVLAVPGGPETTKMIDAEVLNALGPNGYLVNIARGSVVDEEALVAALREKRIAGAALDVFADEPHVPEALLTMENVVLQAHRGSATREVRKAMGDLVVDNLLAHFAGRKPLTPPVV